MDRNIAIVIFFLSLVIFAIILYYGAQITVWSSSILGLFLSWIILNIIYPPTKVANDDADAGLILYIIIEILGLFLLGIYIIQRVFVDIRKKCKK